MPELREFNVQAPSLLIEAFFVEIPRGADWQDWTHQLLSGDKLEFYYEAENAWVQAEISSWDIEDGSGNAPGANAHFFFLIKRDGKSYKFDLDSHCKVRFEAPTQAELIALPKHCEGIEIVQEGTRYSNETWGPCSNPATQKIKGHWYCDECTRAGLATSGLQFALDMTPAYDEKGE